VSVSANRLYHKAVVDHYEKPRNVGSFDKNDPNVGTGLVGEWSADIGVAWGDSSVVTLLWHVGLLMQSHCCCLDDMDVYLDTGRFFPLAVRVMQHSEHVPHTHC
jgi:hypothetical protein